MDKRIILHTSNQICEYFNVLIIVPPKKIRYSTFLENFDTEFLREPLNLSGDPRSGNWKFHNSLVFIASS
jgi:hypothetical protein